MEGLIFAAIAAFWLMYLVPYFLHHRGDDLAEESATEIPFTPSVTIVRSGTSLAEADPGTAEVSTSLTRRAQLRDLQLRDRQAAQRRRRVLIFLLVVQLLVGGLAVFRIGAWWGCADPCRADRGVPGGGAIQRPDDAGRPCPSGGRDLCVPGRGDRCALADGGGRGPARALDRTERPGGGGRLIVGSDPDHSSDLCVEAARAPHRPHHRPLPHRCRPRARSRSLPIRSSHGCAGGPGGCRLNPARRAEDGSDHSRRTHSCPYGQSSHPSGSHRSRRRRWCTSAGCRCRSRSARVSSSTQSSAAASAAVSAQASAPAEAGEADELASDRPVDRRLPARREDRVGGHRPASDVLDLMSDRAASLGLEQSIIERDRRVWKSVTPRRSAGSRAQCSAQSVRAWNSCQGSCMPAVCWQPLTPTR